WGIRDLFHHALSGIGSAVRQEPGLVSIGVDSWAVDYALLQGDRMLAEPFHYRDERTTAGVAATEALVARDELYATNGLQFLTFNTLYQLAADRLEGTLMQADSFLLIPDLINFWLTGRRFTERTNASTTGLLGIRTESWDNALIDRLQLPLGIFPELISAGSEVGALLPELAAELGTGSALRVSAVASHDTASAVVSVPATDPDFAYISCGTWSLVGVELDEPVLSNESRRANFTNEGGVDGRVRYLRNVMGLWMLSESVRQWERSGERIDLGDLLAAATSYTGPVPIVDVNDPRFQPPGDMPARVAEYCVERGLPVPGSRAAMARTIVEGLAVAYADTIETARALTGKTISVVHVVGGGSQNRLLCQLTADRSGLPVVAGPVEATAIGNILVQARAQGLVNGDLETLRGLVARSTSQARYLPRA
ncbi:MAG TPA: rhamnulokinase family protein, partial [Homoserinimonas sp.]|nr:rhamnulokinase family protein [Homoserinimonas sp.]